MRKTLIILSFLTPVAASADTGTDFIALIENDAGAVMTRPGLTHNECEAVKALLSPQNTWAGNNVFSSTSNGTLYLGSAPQPSVKTASITSVKCVTPPDTKK